MYNDRIQNQFTPPRSPFGRSCPTMAMGDDLKKRDMPQVDERMGNRNCDGSLRKNMPDNNLGWGLADHPLAMVYSPYQLFRDIYSPDTALMRGTMFTELDLPFEGDKKRGGICL